ncbi:MAG: response regulator, partial [Sulfurimonas sp.]|nr:response regulator [Sulfurimonas sp.]
EEEGSFGNIDNKKTKIDAGKIKKENPKQYRQKCKVPEHGKISKDNFKEFAGVKILIAEDNLINQKVLNGLLCDSGIEITMADDGQIALDILEKNNDFNIILMDAHMPRVDGFEATRIIRANPNYEHIVVVALSGDTAADDVRKMMESGMQEHLEKPLKVDALYDILYAYTKTDNKTQNSEFIEVIMTKELNGDKGLAVCSGDEEFYIDILNEFVKNYTNSPSQLNKLLENNNIKDADAVLLDIIGVCANIGADNIKNIAQDLKESIKNSQKKDFILLLDKYRNHLKILLKDIEDYKNL